MLSAVSHTVVRRPSGATAGLITVEFNYELSYITTESLISIHPLAPLTRWYHAVCAQSAYRVHTAIVLSENERSWCYLNLSIAFLFFSQLCVCHSCVCATLVTPLPSIKKGLP